MIRQQRFTINGPSSPCVYLAQLRRYGASNIGRTDVNTKKMEEKKEKERRRQRKGKVKKGKKGKEKRNER